MSDSITPLIDAFNAHDVERMVGLCHPDVEITTQRSELEGTWRGHAGLREWAQATFALGADYNLRVAEVHPFGAGRLVLGHQHVSPAGTPPIDAPLTAVLLPAGDGRLLRLRTFADLSAALRTHVEPIIDAVERRDFSALAGLVHPGISFRSSLSVAEGTFEGVDGLRRWASVVDDIWEDYRIEILDVTAVNPVRAVVALRLRGVSRSSRVPLEVRPGQVWDWRDGLLWRAVAHTDVGQARAAASSPSP